MMIQHCASCRIRRREVSGSDPVRVAHTQQLELVGLRGGLETVVTRIQ